MGFEFDEEILQDFLIEAGEILEELSEQLVTLEKTPDDSELLNAIFRGFHTVKGGAGFLSLNDLVDVCHGAENIFDILRTGKRLVTPDLMDVILEALDTINDMFESVQNREPFDPADPELLEELKKLSLPPQEEKVEQKIPVQESTNNLSITSGESIDEITDDEFDKLLDQLHGVKKQASESQIKAQDEATAVIEQIAKRDGDITDDEFENLLDELHGVGNCPSFNENESNSAQVKEVVATPEKKTELITDDEFEKLLDELHGKGVAPNNEKNDSPTIRQEKNIAPAVKPIVVKKEPRKTRKTKKEHSVKQTETTIRVDTSTLDNIMNMVGELVLVRNRLVSLGLNNEDEEISKAVSNLDVVTADLQGAAMKTRMQPIKKVFGKFPRVVRDLARNLKKEIVLELYGEETDLDKNLVEALADPLVHLVRNSVDHGIEMPDERAAVGKPRLGTVTLGASQEGDHILLIIKDDGKGMDADKLRSIAVERGMMDEEAAKRLTDKEAFNLILAPGFSTKKEISDISGRGVGMDVVKTGISQLNGTVDIDSKMGLGTTIEIKVPLTLAILPTMMVGVRNQPFAFPLASVNEIFSLDLRKTNIVDGQLTIFVRDKSIPLFYLQDWLCRSIHNKSEATSREQGHVVIVQIGHQRIGFVVDSLIGQEEVVIKPLDKLLQGTPGMAGATITSDGHIALILDVPGLLRRYA